MTKPLGIIFEEIEAGEGVFVQDLVEGGLAEIQGQIQPGDVLIGVTAVKVVGGKSKNSFKYERSIMWQRLCS